MKNKLRIGLLLLCLCPVLLWGQNVLSTLENMHAVVKGETWESIAADYGVSLSELQAANPDVKRGKLKKKTLLIIPKATQSSSQEEKTNVSVEENREVQPLIRTSISNLKVGVLLPFSDKNMVEFYRGFLMAADSVRQSGVNLVIHAWDCGSTRPQIESLLPQLEGLDVIIGPVSATQIPTVAELCKEQGTRLVLPFSSELTLQDYPLVYHATAPKAVVYDAAVTKLARYYADQNFVVVRGGNPDDSGKMLTEQLTKSLAQRNGTLRVLALEGDDFAYESAFNQFRDNMIVLDDCSIRSLNILLARLKDFRRGHSQYRLSLVAYPEWQSETNRLLDDFFAFDTYMFTPYYYNVLSERTKRFQLTYEKLFRVPIAQVSPRFAAQGFDLGLYFFGGISSLGDTFEQMQGGLSQMPYQNWYQFERGASGMNFSNRFVQFIHFTVDNKIELIQ